MDVCENLLAALVALQAASHSLAAPGELDATFGSSGLATFSVGQGRAAVQQLESRGCCRSVAAMCQAANLRAASSAA